jgi:hypothetical protein
MFSFISYLSLAYKWGISAAQTGAHLSCQAQKSVEFMPISVIWAHFGIGKAKTFAKQKKSS